MPSQLNRQSNRLVCQTFIIKKMELSTKNKGNLTELQCITAFYQLGYQVSIPYGENSRYDFIADVNGRLIRVQAKTSSVKRDTTGAISFATASTRVNSTQNITHHYTKDEIDYFATYWENQCYLIPVEETSSREKTLRFLPPANGQIKGVSFAKDYELEIQLAKINVKEENK